MSSKKLLAAFAALVLFCAEFASAAEPAETRNGLWSQLNLYRGIEQRGGPRPFDDTYLEFEFGGRHDWLDLYGYVDFLDALNDPRHSDKHGKDNFFVDIEPRISLDWLLGRDLSLGPVKEWYLAFDLYYGDAPPGLDRGLKTLWVGVGTDMELPWLGKSGVNLYARYIHENFGASNEKGFDGYVAHINWFKPVHTLSNGAYIAFQGYADYEFGSKLPGNAFEDVYRTNHSFQTYWGLWLHDKRWAVGYGLKGYRNMTQWRDGLPLNGKITDSTGFGHYFNATYKF